MRPMLASRPADRGASPPAGADWVHEIKWDGIRALVDVRDGVRVFSRTERDLTLAFPELAGLAAYDDLLLDGEIVQLADGVPTLAALADRIHLTNAAKAQRLADSRPVTLIVFDVLRAHGRDVMRLPWRDRRDLLEGLGLADVAWQVPATYADGGALMDGARQQGLEGVVSKRVDSIYQPGVRSPNWLKFPIRPTESFVVGGFKWETGSDRRIGSLLVGVPTGGGLAYRGRVGSGLAGRVGQKVLPLLTRGECPFVDVPAAEARGVVWTTPEIVVDVEYLALTMDGRLRQPSFRGVRADLGPDDLEGER